MAEPRTRESKDTNEQQVVTTGDLPGWQWPNAASERHPQPPLPNRRLDAALDAHVVTVPPDSAAPLLRAHVATVPPDSAAPLLSPPLAAHPTPATALDRSTARYRALKLLGRGGMGEVQLSHDGTIGRDVAVKRLLTDRSSDAEARTRFIREAQIQGQLEHPAIVPVYDLSVDADGTIFFTMKRLRGRTLEDILTGLREQRPADVAAFSRHRLLNAFTAVCIAIEFAHSRGVLHRDLKPANVTLERETKVIIPRRGEVLANYGLRCGMIENLVIE